MKRLVAFCVMFGLLGLCPTLALGGDPDYEMSLTHVTSEDPLETESFPIDLSADEDTTVTVSAVLLNNGEPLSGAQGGVCHDSDYFKDLSTDDVTSFDTEDLDTTFTAVNITGNPAGSEGWTFGILMNVATGATIDNGGASFDLYLTEYTVAADVVEGKTESTTLEWCTVGTPPVPPAAIVSGVANDPTLVDATINFPPPPPLLEFVRGDCNADDSVDIADGIYLLNALFQDGPMSDCEDACDSNDDGSMDQSDALYLFYYRFFHTSDDPEAPKGPEPPAPFPDCGIDDTSTPEACEAYDGCA